jgi:hypothetical protein
VIRAAAINDVEQLVDLLLRAKAKSVYATVLANRERMRRTIRQCVSAPQAYARVAEVDGRIVGVLLGIKDQLWFADKLEAKDIAFVSEEPNQSRVLLNDFCAWAWRDGRVFTVAMAQSTGIKVARTARWFQAIGFEQVGGVFLLNRWDAIGEAA